MPQILARIPLKFVIIYIFLAIITGWVSLYGRPTRVSAGADLQQAVWDKFVTRNTDPNRWSLEKIHASRILFPALMQLPQLTGLSKERAFSLLRLLSIIFAFILFHAFLLEWFGDELAFCGTLFMGLTVHLTFKEYFEMPTDFIEIIVFTLGIWAIYRATYFWLGVIVLIGTLNRESTAVLPFFLFFSLFSTKNFRWLIPVFLCGLCWLLPLIFLRWWVDITNPHGYGNSLSHNIPGLLEVFKNPNPYNNYLFWIYLFGAFWVIPYLGWKHQPEFFRRLLVGIPLVILVYFFVGGYLDEPRELVNLYAVLVPASLIALFPNSTALKTNLIDSE